MKNENWRKERRKRKYNKLGQNKRRGESRKEGIR
jgi:hypothetical protein